MIRGLAQTKLRGWSIWIQICGSVTSTSNVVLSILSIFHFQFTVIVHYFYLAEISEVFMRRERPHLSPYKWTFISKGLEHQFLSHSKDKVSLVRWKWLWYEKKLHKKDTLKKKTGARTLRNKVSEFQKSIFLPPELWNATWAIFSDCSLMREFLRLPSHVVQKAIRKVCLIARSHDILQTSREKKARIYSGVYNLGRNFLYRKVAITAQYEKWVELSRRSSFLRTIDF